MVQTLHINSLRVDISIPYRSECPLATARWGRMQKHRGQEHGEMLLRQDAKIERIERINKNAEMQQIAGRHGDISL